MTSYLQLLTYYNLPLVKKQGGKLSKYSVILYCPDQRFDILPGNLRLQQMGRRNQQAAAFTYRFNHMPHIFSHFLRHTEGHGGLRADGTPEGKLLGFQRCGIHTFRLYRVQNIHTDFDKLGNNIIDHTVGVIQGNHIGIHSLCGGNGGSGCGLAPPAPFQFATATIIQERKEKGNR